MIEESTPYQEKPVSPKTCCVCGLGTHPQPQDYNHDKGYGHCYRCLSDSSRYLSFGYKWQNFSLRFWEEKFTENLVVELIQNVSVEDNTSLRVLEHETVAHRSVSSIIGWMNKVYSTEFDINSNQQ